jgi:hypothetical protein
MDRSRAIQDDVRDDQPEPGRRKASGDRQPGVATVQDEDKQNRELLDLSHQILGLPKAVHAYAATGSKEGVGGGPAGPQAQREGT